jgi:hypothetical protein
MPLLPGLLEQFPNRTFIETGMHRGDAIQAAVDAGFEEIFSCDVSPFALGWCCHRFKDVRDRVNLHLQDSRVFLDEEMRGPGGEPCTIWLDAHYCGGNGEVEGYGAHDTAGAEDDHPLLRELAIIDSWGCRTHTILIDDARMFGTGGWPSESEVVRSLLHINRDYVIQRVDSALEGDEILIASI